MPESWLLSQKKTTTTNQNPTFMVGEFLTNTFQGTYHSECLPDVVVDVPS